MMLILFLLALSIFLFSFLQKHRKNRKVLLPPGPPGLPFIGNLHQLDQSNPHHYLWQLSKKYGPLMSLRLGFVPTLVVSSAKMAKEVLKTHDVEFSNRPSMRSSQKLSYNRVDVAFSPYGDYWSEMRKICTLHLFSFNRAQSFRPMREDAVSRMIEKISNLSTSGKLINLSEMVLSLTSSIICTAAFGKRYEDEGYARSRFHSLLHETQAMLAGFFLSDYFPLMGWVDKLTGMCARLDKNFQDFDLFYQEIIDEHLNPQRPKSMQESFVEILLQLKKDRLTSFDLTMDHIKAVLMNIFIGGTDPGAATIIWVMTVVMKNPRVMKKVQEEVRKLIGKKGMVDEDDVHKLPYLKAVVKEGMRLYPPFPLLVARETIGKCIIDGYEIQPKTLIYVSAWAIGRDPECWENPEVFWPERFLDSSIDFRGRDFELIPFGAGRRGCPGTNHGAVVVELALANLLYSFDWEVPAGMTIEDIDTDEMPGVTVHKKNALCLMARNYA